MRLPGKRIILPLFSIAFLLLVINSCRHKPNVVDTASDSGYPPEIEKILVSRCTEGCHNAASASASGGLRLDVWDRLFDGGAQGAAIIPYDTLNSSFLYFINADPSLGLTASPLMPYSPDASKPATPLTRDEYLTIRHWIAMGAPDKNGVIPFASNPDTRQKMYLTEQACDYVSVIDAERHVIMRNIKIGTNDVSAEIAHCVRVDNQGRYAYVSFTNGNVVQKIDTRTDQVVDSVQLNFPGAQWNILHVSDDGSRVLVTGLVGNIAKLINTTSPMSVIATNINMKLLSPHGIASNVAFDTFYITGQTGNKVYKATASGYVKVISIDANLPSSLQSQDPHEIIMTPDRSKYFLTCQDSNQVRVMDAHADTLMYVFNVPTYPQEMAISTVRPYVYITCQEYSISPTSKGAVVVIDYNTMQIVKTITGDFFQPHGITVDESRGLLYVASRNFSNGVAPHHSSNCAGSNGWYNIYDINNNWQRIGNKFEAMPDCYSFDSRFKQN